MIGRVPGALRMVRCCIESPRSATALLFFRYVRGVTSFPLIQHASSQEVECVTGQHSLFIKKVDRLYRSRERGKAKWYYVGEVQPTRENMEMSGNVKLFFGISKCSLGLQQMTASLLCGRYWYAAPLQLSFRYVPAATSIVVLSNARSTARWMVATAVVEDMPSLPSSPVAASTYSIECDPD